MANKEKFLNTPINLSGIISDKDDENIENNTSIKAKTFTYPMYKIVSCPTISLSDIKCKRFFIIDPLPSWQEMTEKFLNSKE